MFTDSEKK